MQTRLRHKARQALRKVGLDVQPIRPRESAQRRAALFAANAVTLVVDGGANHGGYGRALRECGYVGRILSLEPLSSPFRRLCVTAQGDPNWECRQLAIGDRNVTLTMNVSNQGEVASSLLPASPERPLEVARLPSEAGLIRYEFIGTERVNVVTLDSLALSDDRIALKLDLEGYEPQALDGAQATLGRVRVIEIELCLLRNSSNGKVQPGSYRAMLDRLEQQGFMLVGIEPLLGDSSGRVVQMDAMLERI